MSAAYRFSVLIVTWKGDDMLLDCLDSLAAIYANRPEIVVVDNAGLESTRLIAARYANVQYISSADNLGFAGGNNLGWPLTTNEYVVLLNNDTRLTGDSIAPLIDYLDGHPQCAAAQGTVVYEDDPDLTDGTGLWWSPLGVLAAEGSRTSLSVAPKTPREVFSVGGAFFVIRRSAVEPAGGLFYDHFKSYYEEINLCHRLWLAGFRCAYVPTIPVLHRHSATASRLGWERILRQYYRNIWFSTLTCFDWYGLLRFVPPLFLLCAAQSLVAMIKGRHDIAGSHLSNLRRLWQERGLIRRTRRDVRGRAVLSDWVLFKSAVRSQPWSYYWRLIRRG